MFAQPRYTPVESLAAALRAFMTKHGTAGKGHSDLVVDVCTLFHFGVWNLPSETLSLVRKALLDPTDVEAAQAASRAIYLSRRTGVLSTFLRAIGKDARDYFKVTFVFEHSSATYVRCFFVITPEHNWSGVRSAGVVMGRAVNFGWGRGRGIGVRLFVMGYYGLLWPALAVSARVVGRYGSGVHDFCFFFAARQLTLNDTNGRMILI